MKNFRELKVWEKAHQLTLKIYNSTERFPRTEIYGLINQMRRAASSIASNIAEGCVRGSDADFARFLQIAMGSASELEYQMLLAHDLNFLNNAGYEELEKKVTEVKRMLTVFIKKLKVDSRKLKADSHEDR